jgi:hypothetical protein
MTSSPDFDPAVSARALQDAARPARPAGPPPGSRAAPPPRPTPRPPARGPQLNIEDGMRELYVGLGMLLMIRDPELGIMVVGEKRFMEMMQAQKDGEPTPLADTAPKAWSDLAEQNRTVHDALSKILTTSAWAEVMNAHLPLFLLLWQRAKPKIKLGSALGRLRLFRRKNRSAPTSGSPPNASAEKPSG